APVTAARTVFAITIDRTALLSLRPIASLIRTDATDVDSEDTITTRFFRLIATLNQATCVKPPSSPARTVLQNQSEGIVVMPASAAGSIKRTIRLRISGLIAVGWYSPRTRLSSRRPTVSNSTPRPTPASTNATATPSKPATYAPTVHK